MESQMVLCLLVCMFAVDGPVGDSIKAIQVNLAGIKCIVSGKPATSQYFAKFKNRKIYFDCNTSRLKFETNRNEFATKANHQLVITGQYVQTRCPIQSATISASSSSIQIAGVKIRTCCVECLSKLTDDKTVLQQIDFLFADRQFDKIFDPNQEISNASANSSRR